MLYLIHHPSMIAFLFLIFSCCLCQPALLFQPIEDFRDGIPRHIVVSSFLGGLSHIRPAFEILQVLQKRADYRITYITNDEQLHLARPYDFRTVSLGSPAYPKKIFNMHLRNIVQHTPRTITMLDFYHTWLTPEHKNQYLQFKEAIEKDRPDLILCDFMSSLCVDVAFTLEIPFVLFGHHLTSTDAEAPYTPLPLWLKEPTTEHLSLLERLKAAFMHVWFIYKMYPLVKNLNLERQAVGVEPVWRLPDGQWHDSVKLVSSFFGFQSPRPLGPLVQLIGPVMNSAYDPLTAELSEFLDRHHAVVYVAFGQNVAPTTAELSMFLESLATNLAFGVIDGVIWASVQSNAGDFPATVTVTIPSSSSNSTATTTLSTADLLANSNPDFWFLPWAPQFTVLSHPSTVLFLSHGGAESVCEALYAGVPLLIHAIYGDQPSNGVKMARAGVALISDRAHLDTRAMTENIRRIVQDDDGSFAKNIQRMKALAQIGSRRKELAADILEMIMYTTVNGTQLPHLYTADRRMSWVKANNYDVYAVVGVFVIVAIASLMEFAVLACRVTWRVVCMGSGVARLVSRGKTLRNPVASIAKNK